ncbi:hypothetical protein FB567DRAFT_328317 [Paraphoma chrysanthemicola]|uniref:Uncharacterized protein n=1 Tax=Paraphoma chrysanthemicola TaxID=798071 RepID=A0A8K0R8K2_9PLEO|nr:hypothetical protein FB567DRAFT_328317 [Paraphoma chrysanthemicola]
MHLITRDAWAAYFATTQREFAALGKFTQAAKERAIDAAFVEIKAEASYEPASALCDHITGKLKTSKTYTFSRFSGIRDHKVKKMIIDEVCARVMDVVTVVEEGNESQRRGHSTPSSAGQIATPISAPAGPLRSRPALLRFRLDPIGFQFYSSSAIRINSCCCSSGFSADSPSNSHQRSRRGRMPVPKLCKGLQNPFGLPLPYVKQA